ncbi:hypothetical protein HZS_4979 [Henneguya salminicola]|nr:hypothetical protein HZS_4979 [Henneguya salminicola]
MLILVSIFLNMHMLSMVTVPFKCLHPERANCNYIINCQIYMNDGLRHTIEYNLRCSDESIFIILGKKLNKNRTVKNRIHLTKWNSILFLDKYPTEKFKSIFGMISNMNYTTLFVLIIVLIRLIQ